MPNHSTLPEVWSCQGIRVCAEPYLLGNVQRDAQRYALHQIERLKLWIHHFSRRIQVEDLANKAMHPTRLAVARFDRR